MTKTTAILACLYLTIITIALYALAILTAQYIDAARLLYDYSPPVQHIEIIEQVDTDRLDDIDERVRELEDFVSRAEVYEVTGYAPLDPNAVEGMCFSGDPNVTASGGSPIPYLTVAASREFEFGQRLWVEGVGVVEVNDRGGAIKGKRLDLVLPTRKEALIWGKKRLRVVVL